MDRFMIRGDCSNAVAYYGVLTFNTTMAVATVALSLVAIYKLIPRKCRAETRCSILFVSHVLFFPVCIVSSVARIPVIASLCEAVAVKYLHSPMLLPAYVASFLLHWIFLIMIHSNRLRSVFDGTELRATACTPVLSSLIVTACSTAFALQIIGFAYDISLLKRASYPLTLVTALGLVLASKITATGFIIKFAKLNNKIAGVDIDGDCIDFVRLLTKSAILATISLLSSSTVALCSAPVVLGFTSDAWYLRLSLHSVDMLINCACVYLSLQVGSAHYDLLCEPVQSRCQAKCLGISRNRRASAVRRSVANANASNASAPSPREQATEEERQELRRMSRRISFNVSSSTMIAHRSSMVVHRSSGAAIQKLEMPSMHELQEGGAPAADIAPARTVMGRRIEMDPEEQL